MVLFCLVFFLRKKNTKSNKKSFAREMAKLSGNVLVGGASVGSASVGSDFEIYMKNLESRLEMIFSVNREIRDKILILEGQMGVLLTRKDSEEVPKSLEEQIYEAYDQGKKITDIARSFGRDKGEVELILNIRRLKNNREDAL